MFRVRLRQPVESVVAVEFSRRSGPAGLAADSIRIEFDESNWSLWQTVQISAAASTAGQFSVFEILSDALQPIREIYVEAVEQAALTGSKAGSPMRESS